MYKTFLLSFLLFAVQPSLGKILNEAEEVHVSSFCSTKLINLYTQGDDPYGSTRSSFVPSEKLKTSCLGLTDSCCLDEEFEAMTDLARRNLEHLYDGVKEARLAFDMLKQLTGKKIQAIIKEVGPQELERLDLTAEDAAEDLGYLRSERGDISLDLFNTFKMVEEFGGGLNCTLCEAANHANFSNIESVDKLRLRFDFNYCYALFNSEYLLSTLDFVRHLKPLTTLSKLLSGFYKVHVGDHFRDSIEKVDQIDQLRVSCLASTDDFSDDEQCAEMCIELGKPNQFFFRDIIRPLTTFVVLVTDYLGSQELLKANSSEAPALGNEESVVSPEETIQAFIDNWDVVYILPPAEEDSPLNLNRMKVELTYDKGWNFHQVRMRRWGIAEGAAALKGALALALALGLSFLL